LCDLNFSPGVDPTCFCLYALDALCRVDFT
jgi:hypothetical protein